MSRQPLRLASPTPPSRMTQMADAIRVTGEGLGEPVTADDLALLGFTPREIETLGQVAARVARRCSTRQTDAAWRKAA